MLSVSDVNLPKLKGVCTPEEIRDKKIVKDIQKIKMEWNSYNNNKPFLKVNRKLITQSPEINM